MRVGLHAAILVAACMLSPSAHAARGGLVFSTVFTAMGSGLEQQGPLRGFDAGKNGSVVVHGDKTLRDTGGKKDLLQIKEGRIEAAAMTGNLPVVLAEGRLRIFEKGQWTDLLEVPLKAPKLAANAKTLWLTGIPAEGSKPALFVYEEGKGFQHLLNLPEPVDAISVDDRGRLYYSIGPAIFSLLPGEPVVQLAVLAGFDRIDSIAPDSENALIYLSDGQALYTLNLNDASLTLILDDMGGPLRFRNDKLYLLSQDLGTVTEISGLSKALVNDKDSTEELKDEPL